MAKMDAIVIYDDLNQSGNSDLPAVGEAIGNAQACLGEVSAAIEVIESAHACMSESVTAATELSTVLSNWQTQNEFLISSCKLIVATFTDAEGNIITDASNIPKESLEALAPLIGMISEQTGVEFDPNDIGLKVYKDHDAYSKENEELPDTGAEESEKVWSELFDEDDEGKLELTETGAVIAKVAESVIGDTEEGSDEDSSEEDDKKRRKRRRRKRRRRKRRRRVYSSKK